LKRIGVPDIVAATSRFDPGYDPSTLASHLQQRAHLISMACWMVANARATRTKIGFDNVRLEELLRVEIYRRGLHSDAFGHTKLRPGSTRIPAI
jgi:hypothetical protein